MEKDNERKIERNKNEGKNGGSRKGKVNGGTGGWWWVVQEARGWKICISSLALSSCFTSALFCHPRFSLSSPIPCLRVLYAQGGPSKHDRSSLSKRNELKMSDKRAKFILRVTSRVFSYRRSNDVAAKCYCTSQFKMEIAFFTPLAPEK